MSTELHIILMGLLGIGTGAILLMLFNVLMYRVFFKEWPWSLFKKE